MDSKIRNIGIARPRAKTYYERWIASIEAILIEKKVLTKEEIDHKLAEFESKWGEP